MTIRSEFFVRESLNRFGSLFFSALLAIGFLSPSTGRTAGVGLDNASNPNYPPAGQSLALNTWVDTGNVAGAAFGGWYFEGNGNWSIGTANQASLGSGSSGMDTGGKSLVVRGFNSATTNATPKRPATLNREGCLRANTFRWISR